MEKKFIITSNIFFLAPILTALYTHAWLYFAIALLAGVISPLFHYLFEFKTDTLLCKVVRVMDWTIAIVAFAYLFYCVFTLVSFSLRAPLALILGGTILFFWYGFESTNYKKLHPWFHVITPLVATVILLSEYI